MEFKAIPSAVKAINGRTVIGIASVFGNVDSYGDIVWPGAFAKTIQERRSRFKHLWMHSWFDPPTAVIDDIREVTREELPEQVLEVAPEALGGLEVTRTYLDTPRGNEILTGIRAGVPLEMSFGFESVKVDFDETEDGRHVRNLREIRLYETSDVIFGANPATAASKASTEMLLQQLDIFMRELKAGARHSARDMTLLQAIHDSALELGAICETAADDEEDDDKADPGAAAVALPEMVLRQKRLRAAGLALALK